MEVTITQAQVIQEMAHQMAQLQTDLAIARAEIAAWKAKALEVHEGNNVPAEPVLKEVVG